MNLPHFTADRSLQPSGRSYRSGPADGGLASAASQLTPACAGTECHGTNESCCCASKCVVTGMGCHCDIAAVEM